MSKPAVEIKGLSKAYMIGHEREAMAGTMTFRDSLVNIARKPYELFTGHQLKKEKFWALKDVNLEIQQGDVVGIIGRNGSGKSTLLKILSRIVEPTKGEVIMRGRVASLLEVGTGFHPELTGRENVYFNGAILGMTRKEIQSKFDEIVAFSEVEKFLDTPVKFYSSGMYVRLAFAVAAHLDPDILIVDEVLAVGDAAFQKKCIGKMKDVAGQGRTVLYVSHNMKSVKQLCNKSVLLSNGEILKMGNTEKVLSEYSKLYLDQNPTTEWAGEDDSQNEYMRLDYVKLINSKKSKLMGSMKSSDELDVEVKVEILKLDDNLTFGYSLLNDEGESLFWSYQSDSIESPRLTLGDNVITTKLPLGILSEGRYTLEIIGGIHNQSWFYQPGDSKISVSFYLSIDDGLTSDLYSSNRPTAISPIIKWRKRK